MATVFSSVRKTALTTVIMAICFGVIGLRQGEFGRRRAITGIVLGTVALLMGAVLVVSMAMMQPYAEDLMRIFEEYMRSVQ